MLVGKLMKTRVNGGATTSKRARDTVPLAGIAVPLETMTVSLVAGTMTRLFTPPAMNLPKSRSLPLVTDTGLTIWVSLVAGNAWTADAAQSATPTAAHRGANRLAPVFTSSALIATLANLVSGKGEYPVNLVCHDCVGRMRRLSRFHAQSSHFYSQPLQTICRR